MRATYLCFAAICVGLVGCATTEVGEPKFSYDSLAREAFAARLRATEQREYVSNITRLILDKFTYAGPMPVARPFYVTVISRIGAGGTILGPRVIGSSGIEGLDQAVLRAFDDSTPWPPPPPWLAHTDIIFRVKLP